MLLSDFSSDKQALQATSELSEKLVNIIAQPFYIDSLEFYVSVSIGITVFPQDGNNIDFLVRNADIAMYHAKDKGRNRSEYYHARMNEIAEKRSRMESELRTAVSRGQLLLHYQPVVDVVNGEVMWFEALLRWQHPRLGLVLPDEFVGLAEETGLIVPIGEWVIESAVEAVLGFRKIACRIFAYFEPVAGSPNGVLEVARQGVNPVKTIQFRTLTRVNHHPLMMCDLRSSGQEAGQSIGDHQRIDIQCPFRPVRERGLAKIWQGIEADADRLGQPAFRVRTGFHGNHEGPLSGGPSASVAATSSAQVGIIGLHPASQDPVRFPFLHGPEELVLETPGRPPGDPQAAHQFQGRHAVLGLSDQIYGQKESVHPKGSLMMAAAALVQSLLSTAKYGAVVVSALWAPKTVTPAYLLQRRFTLGFSTILRQEIRQ